MPFHFMITNTHLLIRGAQKHFYYFAGSFSFISCILIKISIALRNLMGLESLDASLENVYMI